MTAARAAASALAVILATSACASGRGGFVSPVTSERFFVAGYHAYWAGDAWTSYRLDALDELFFFEIEVAADGTFLDRHGWPTRWRSMVSTTLEAGTQVTPTVSMHDPEAFEQLFQDRVAVERLVAGVVDLVHATPGLAGVHLDFEVFQPVQPAARDGYSDFVARLRAALRSVDPRLSLSVFTLAFDDDDVYDELALAAAADYLVVQGYDYHHAASANAGPVAPLRGWGRLNWEGVVARFAALGVSPRRIVMTVPLYGYQWPVADAGPGAPTTGPAVAIPLTAPADVVPELPRAGAQGDAHGVRRDPVSGSPYYVFRDELGWHQGWYEDAESLAAKYDFVRRLGLGGIALFPVAYADDATWDRLGEAFRAPRF